MSRPDLDPDEADCWDDCPVCGGSGGGTDPGTICEHCNGSGENPHITPSPDFEDYPCD